MGPSSCLNKESGRCGWEGHKTVINVTLPWVSWCCLCALGMLMGMLVGMLVGMQGCQQRW